MARTLRLEAVRGEEEDPKINVESEESRRRRERESVCVCVCVLPKSSGMSDPLVHKKSSKVSGVRVSWTIGYTESYKNPGGTRRNVTSEGFGTTPNQSRRRFGARRSLSPHVFCVSCVPCGAFLTLTPPPSACSLPSGIPSASRLGALGR
jgi:hypothetical protein